MHGAVPPLRSSHLNKFQYLRSPQILKFSTAAFYAFFFLPHLCSAHIRFILHLHAGAAWQFLLLFSPFFCCVLFIKNHSSSLCLSLFVSRSQAHTDTHTHLSFFPCTYCMSLRQTVSVIGLFFSSPV